MDSDGFVLAVSYGSFVFIIWMLPSVTLVPVIRSARFSQIIILKGVPRCAFLFPGCDMTTIYFNSAIHGRVLTTILIAAAPGAVRVVIWRILVPRMLDSSASTGPPFLIASTPLRLCDVEMSRNAEWRMAAAMALRFPTRWR